jgi:thioredoxin-related protein
MILRISILIALLAITAPLHSCSQRAGKAAPDWKPLGEALTDGATQGRIILVDVYTDWCKWCKRMDSEVYADNAVAQYLGNNFIVSKLNAESSVRHSIDNSQATEREIAQAWGVTGYPATVFLASNGDPITVVPGYIPKERFLHMLEYMHTGSYQTISWEDFLRRKAG